MAETKLQPLHYQSHHLALIKRALANYQGPSVDYMCIVSRFYFEYYAEDCPEHPEFRPKCDAMMEMALLHLAEDDPIDGLKLFATTAEQGPALREIVSTLLGADYYLLIDGHWKNRPIYGCLPCTSYEAKLHVGELMDSTKNRLFAAGRSIF